jgi:hypothetical protein
LQGCFVLFFSSVFQIQLLKAGGDAFPLTGDSGAILGMVSGLRPPDSRLENCTAPAYTSAHRHTHTSIHLYVCTQDHTHFSVSSCHSGQTQCVMCFSFLTWSRWDRGDLWVTLTPPAPGGQQTGT